MLVPEEFLTIRSAVMTASNGETISVNFGRPNGKRSAVSGQRINGKEITFEVRGEGKEELFKMITNVNYLPSINNGNQLFAFLDPGWQDQGWVNRPDTNSFDAQACIAIDSFNCPWVTWTGYGSTYTQAYTKWNGVNWNEERGVGPNRPGVICRLRPSISFDNWNIAHLVWDNANYDNTSDIGYSHWSDTCWSDEIQVNLSDSSELDFAPQIACGGGQIWCVWYGGPTDVSPYKIYASRWNGTGWIPDMTVSPPDSFDHWWCSIAVDSAGTPHVVWCELPHCVIYYSYYDGLSWSNPIAVNDTSIVRAASWADPRIMIDSNGNLHVCWTGVSIGATRRDIFYSKYSGAQWSSATKISHDSIFNEWYSDIAVDGPNNIWVTFDRQGEGSDQFRVYASHFDVTSWSNETRLDNDISYHDDWTSIRLDKNGSPWVVFEGIPYSASNFDVFYNRYINGTAIEEHASNIKAMQLFSKPVPNPFMTNSKISYQVINSSHVDLKIYNLNGKCIKTLTNGYKTKGEYTVVWDGTDYNNKNVQIGIYFCLLRIGQTKDIRKLIFLR